MMFGSVKFYLELERFISTTIFEHYDISPELGKIKNKYLECYFK